MFWLEKTLERETGFEPATSTLARSHSTTELLPLVAPFYSSGILGDNSRQSRESREFLSLVAPFPHCIEPAFCTELIEETLLNFT